VTKKYRRRVVVDHLSLLVEGGDIFGFLGKTARENQRPFAALGLVR
jgi:ABC-type uncharacterized transport system ATPase subunit